MSSPTRGSTTSTTQIEVDWTTLTTSTLTGGSSIISYNLKWNAGSGSTFYDLVGYTSYYTGSSFTITTSLTAGTSYDFKVRARNSYGWGDYSSVATISATDKPATMSAVTVALSNTDVRISWSAPSSNSDTITKYKILILQSDGTYSEDTTDCDGTDSTIISQ